MPLLESRKAAKEAGLRYFSDETPGWRRVASGKNFRFIDQRGKSIRNEKEIARVRRLAIPPAWTGVWICPSGKGHIQATGRDARGRKQYRYHPDWRLTRDGTKFERMIAFGRVLPKIRRRTARDLRAHGLNRNKVIAAMIRLLDTVHIRVGNEEYAKQNHSFGLTTLRDRHVRISRGTMRFKFIGKSGKMHDIELHDARVARIVRQAQEIPGQELFQYLNEEGERQKVNSEDVNAYLREAVGDEFSAKDFRTWGGTVLAALALSELMTDPHAKPTRKNLQAAITRVAERLGNTPSVCRKCYIHPTVIESYLAGETIGLLRPKVTAASWRAGWRLGLEEMALLNFLRGKLRQTKPQLDTLLRRSIARGGRKKTSGPHV